MLGASSPCAPAVFWGCGSHSDGHHKARQQGLEPRGPHPAACSWPRAPFLLVLALSLLLPEGCCHALPTQGWAQECVGVSRQGEVKPCSKKEISCARQG